jgi:hypothetical protein
MVCVSARKVWVSICLLTSVLFLNNNSATGQELSAPEPFTRAAKRLEEISSVVKKQLGTVKAVNTAASNRVVASKKLSPDISSIKQLGGNMALENVMRMNELAPVSNPLRFDFLQDHQSRLERFATNLDDMRTVIATLPPELAKQRLDAIIVPPDIQEMLQLGVEGQALPLPPHLQGPSKTSAMTLTPYVVGPGSAPTLDYPSVAVISFVWPGHGASALCTGTLISPKAVLTAAHCFCDLVESRSAGLCGSKTYKRGLEEVSATDTRFLSVFFHDRGTIPIAGIAIHSEYEFPKKDLAIITLAEEVSEVMPAPLNTIRPMKPGEFATIVGYGTHSPMNASGIPTPGPPVNASEGIKLWATVKTAACKNTVVGDAICWSYQERAESRILGSTCHGDSGGPAFANIEGSWKLVGVTSGGPKNCQPGSEQAFDVDVYRNIAWIASIVGNNSNPTFATNPNAFIKNLSNRAFGTPYFVFTNRPDQFSDHFFVPSSVGSLRVSVNTTPTFSTLKLEALSPVSGEVMCSASGRDSFASCIVASPSSGSWTIRITGASPQEAQIVAAVNR